MNAKYLEADSMDLCNQICRLENAFANQKINGDKFTHGRMHSEHKYAPSLNKPACKTRICCFFGLEEIFSFHFSFAKYLYANYTAEEEKVEVN